MFYVSIINIFTDILYLAFTLVVIVCYHTQVITNVIKFLLTTPLNLFFFYKNKLLEIYKPITEKYFILNIFLPYLSLISISNDRYLRSFSLAILFLPRGSRQRNILVFLYSNPAIYVVSINASFIFCKSMFVLY